MRRNEKGIALLQMLILFALLGVFEAGFISYLTTLQKGRQMAQTRLDRQQLLERTSSAIVLPNGLDESLGLVAGNEALKVCIKGGPLGACTENCCENGKKTAFFFLDPLDPEQDIEKKHRLTGSELDPAFYTPSGLPCTNTDSTTCAFKLVSSFSAHCPGDDAFCDHAEHLNIEIALTATSVLSIKPQTQTLYYLVHSNYQPHIKPVSPITLTLNQSLDVPISGDSGHPSEVQNFTYTRCESLNPAIVALTCQAFSGGETFVRIEGKSLGKSTIVLQIKDPGFEHGISPEATFEVEVKAP